MNFSSQWLTGVAAWAAAHDTSGALGGEVGRPSGAGRVSIRRVSPTPTESLVEAKSVVMTWRGPVYATECVPGRVWRPSITGLPPTFVAR